MYKREATQITLPEDFLLPFEGKFDRHNRWVRMASLVPWWDYENLYAAAFKNSRRGKPAYGVRMALGALLIQERLGLTDRETIALIGENPYMQYFLGNDRFVTDRCSAFPRCSAFGADWAVRSFGRRVSGFAALWRQRRKNNSVTKHTH